MSAYAREACVTGCAARPTGSDDVCYGEVMPSSPTTSSVHTGAAFAEWYRRNRLRSRQLFDVLVDEAYYSQPIALRHPVVFYEGHLPAFSFNTLIKRGLGKPGIDARLEALFARGIDPHEAAAAASESGSGGGRNGWPTRETLQQFAAEADRQVLD